MVLASIENVMGTDDLIARLKALSDRLDRIRRQSREIHDIVAAEVRSAHTSRRQQGVPNQEDPSPARPADESW